MPQQPNMARHGGGVGEVFLFDLFFLLLLVLNTVETHFKIHVADYIMVLELSVVFSLALMSISCPKATSIMDRSPRDRRIEMVTTTWWIVTAFSITLVTR